MCKKLKRKRVNSTRVMTWNAQGLDDSNKRRKLDEFVKNEEIDVLIVQEGSKGYENPIEETCQASTAFELAAENKEFTLLFNGQTQIKPVGGKVRRTPYNLKFDSDAWEITRDEDEVDYVKSPAIQRWITQPVVDAKNSGEIFIGGSDRRPSLKTKSGNLGELTVLKGKVQRRVDMLARQRPKCLRSKKDDRKIFFFHAPLGGETRLDEVGLDTQGKSDFTGSAAFGSGGQVAPAVNIMFRMAVSGYDDKNGQVKSFPDNVIFVGDTNVQKGGMEKIFSGANIETSNDGLCHVVTNSNMEIVSTERDELTVGKSDHDWVIADVDNPV